MNRRQWFHCWSLYCQWEGNSVASFAATFGLPLSFVERLADVKQWSYEDREAWFATENHTPLDLVVYRFHWLQLLAFILAGLLTGLLF